MEKTKIMSRDYWSLAVKNCTNTKMLAIAAVITALRIAVKAFTIPLLSTHLVIAFSRYFDVVGSFIYGPVLALFSGAISDTLGAIIFPLGDYFLPYIIPEMLGSFIYALFLWNQKRITVTKVLLSRFTVNIICNILLNSIILKWQSVLFGWEQAINLFNLLRIAKNLILFPLEGILMAIVISAVINPLKRMGIVSRETEGEELSVKSIATVTALLIISIVLVILFVKYLMPLISDNNIVFF